MKRAMVSMACGALLLTAGPSLCEAKDYSVGLKASTLGVGVEGQYTLNSFFGARLGANYFTFDRDDTVGDTDYNLDITLQSISAMLDWHPFQGTFRISGGLLYNRNELEALGKPRADSTFVIGNTAFPAAQVGTLNGTIDFNKIAPYLGIGWDTSFGREHTFGFIAELGAVFQGSPDVRLAASGPVAGDAAFQVELERERQQLEDDIDDFKVYPLVSLGMVYRF